MYEIIYDEVEENELDNKKVKETIKECYKEEKLETSKLEISITITTPKMIRVINKEHRNIDKETDVLSFPMFERAEIEEKILNNDFEVFDVLGDIVISKEQVENQAIEYGHCYEKELRYMLIHGFYHLMGYDHMQDEEKKEMRIKEEVIVMKMENLLGHEEQEKE